MEDIKKLDDIEEHDDFEGYNDEEHNHGKIKKLILLLKWKPHF